MKLFAIAVSGAFCLWSAAASAQTIQPIDLTRWAPVERLVVGSNGYVSYDASVGLAGTAVAAGEGQLRILSTGPSGSPNGVVVADVPNASNPFSSSLQLNTGPVGSAGVNLANPTQANLDEDTIELFYEDGDTGYLLTASTDGQNLDAIDFAPGGDLASIDDFFQSDAKIDLTEFGIAAVPVPASMSLMLLGVAGFGMLRLRARS